MSLATFKRKTTNKYSSATKRSGKPPGGFWFPQGPFGRPTTLSSVMFAQGIQNYGSSGFSLEGSHRSIPVGKEMSFSQQGTRYKGIYPVGHGGHNGKYFQAEPVFNAGLGKITVEGNQSHFIKPSTVSTKAMINKRFKWINSGQYPNNWVQPNYTGNQTDSASQGLYIQQVSASNTCVVDVNSKEKYIDYYKRSGPAGCHTTTAKGYTMNLLQSNAPYTKTLYNTQTSSQHTLNLERKCSNPDPHQKPFPFAVQTGTGIQSGGATNVSVGSACNTSNYVIRPPLWYTT
jgi:hypothetical protein